jgi:hypothetical protein
MQLGLSAHVWTPLFTTFRRLTHLPLTILNGLYMMSPIFATGGLGDDFTEESRFNMMMRIYILMRNITFRL